jgi:hypothetical protein
MTKLTSVEADMRPLFTELDIHTMSKAFNLANYDDAKAHAAAIYDCVRGIGGAVMPPPPPRGDGPWPQSRIVWIRDTAGGRLPALDCRKPPKRAAAIYASRPAGAVSANELHFLSRDARSHPASSAPAS